MWQRSCLLLASISSKVYAINSGYFDLWSDSKEEKSYRSFNLSFSYVYDVLSLNNSSFWDLTHCIFPKELENKDTKHNIQSTSYIELHLDIVGKGKLFIPYCQLWSLATSLQLLRMEFLYHNSYEMSELAVTTQTFCIVLDFLLHVLDCVM